MSFKQLFVLGRRSDHECYRPECRFSYSFSTLTRDK